MSRSFLAMVNFANLRIFSVDNHAYTIPSMNTIESMPSHMSIKSPKNTNKSSTFFASKTFFFHTSLHSITATHQPRYIHHTSASAHPPHISLGTPTTHQPWYTHHTSAPVHPPHISLGTSTTHQLWNIHHTSASVHPPHSSLGISTTLTTHQPHYTHHTAASVHSPHISLTIPTIDQPQYTHHTSDSAYQPHISLGIPTSKANTIAICLSLTLHDSTTHLLRHQNYDTISMNFSDHHDLYLLHSSAACCNHFCSISPTVNNTYQPCSFTNHFSTQTTYIPSSKPTPQNTNCTSWHTANYACILHDEGLCISFQCR